MLDRLRGRLRLRSRLGPNLATGIACFVLGKLTLLLATPPGWASAVQPVAGIALAAVLLRGPGVWPGILLGTWIAHLGLPLEAGGVHIPFASSALSLLIGTGMVLQALAGDRLVRRFAGYPSSLTEGPDVLRFLVLSGPVSSLIGATVSLLAVLIFGQIPRSDLAFAWGAWWMGTSIGAALFAPLTLLWIPGTPRAGLRRRILVTAPLAMILALSVVLFFQVSARAREQAATEFERRADDLANGLVRTFDGSIGVLDSLGSFYDASDRIDRREFSTFARFALSRSSGVRTLAWCPRVRGSERAGCIRSGRLEVDPDYAILERDARGELVPAAKRDEYVPTFYLETRVKGAGGLGFDAASDPDRRAALDRARDGGESVAVPPAEIGAGKERRLVFTVYRPVFGHAEPHGTPAERRTSLVGYASAEFCVEDLMRSVLPGALTEGVEIELCDVTDAPHVRSLHSLPAAESRSRVASSTQRTTRYRIGGRTWELRFTPGVEASTGHHAWASWLVLAAGLLFTGLLESFLLVVTGRTDAIEELVARRTVELQQANASLRHEVGERARAEAQHESSELRLAKAQEIAHLGSWELDLESRVVLCSDELLRIHGAEPLEARLDLDRFLARIHPEDRELVALAIEQAARDAKPFSHRHRIIRPDKEIRTLDAHGEVILDAEKKPIRIHGTGQDVTELQEAERELARRTLELERSNAELERFAYVASHDLQEPLRAVASHVQILEQDYQGRLDPEADESIRCAVEGAQRMHDLINDYLAYSRIRAGSEPLRPTASGKALEIALKNLELSIREAAAEVSRGEMPEVLADPAQLVPLFQNLVGNAVKFRGDDPPRIRIAATREQGAWIFSVSDNGIGIDPEHSGRIFSMFRRLHTQDRYPGTGIGLAICKKIVERHGGRIWVESKSGAGSTFFFTLPACPADAERKEGVEDTIAAGSGSPEGAG